jgi:flavin-binding protein dodecin
MTPAEAAINVEFVNETDVDNAVKEALQRAHVTLEDLRQQAQASRFVSDQARTAWFVISPFVARA